MGQWVAIVWQVCFIYFTFLLFTRTSRILVFPLRVSTPSHPSNHWGGFATAQVQQQQQSLLVPIKLGYINNAKSKQPNSIYHCNAAVLERFLYFLPLEMVTNHQVDSLKNAVGRWGISVLLFISNLYI
jgi:hypothetical protein